MMWLIRAGRNATYYDAILDSQKVYLPWEGYYFDFNALKTKEEYRLAVGTEKNTDNRTSVATWVGQILDFVQKMQIGDYVLIPSKGSHTYVLAVITGNYEYNADRCDCLQHSHTIKILIKDFPREKFSQQIQYSLGAFRTVFRVKYENEILQAIKTWQNNTR
jgi:restriction system protein